VQAAGNHQVQHQPEIAFHSDGNSLADSPQLAHLAALHARNWRLRGPQQKGACQSYVLDRLPDDTGFKGGDIGGYVGEFRHVGCACRDVASNVSTDNLR
jgi:hypothetical protein